MICICTCVFDYNEGPKMEIEYTIIKCHIERKKGTLFILTNLHTSNTVFHAFKIYDDTLDLG